MENINEVYRNNKPIGIIIKYPIVLPGTAPDPKTN
jgi:hypothetical protein